MDEEDVTRPHGARNNETAPAMRLSHEWPTMVGEAKERIQEALARGCGTRFPGGVKCAHQFAAITLRDIRGSKRVEVQCGGCGRSICGSIGRNLFSFGWKQFPAWNEELCRRHKAEWEAEHQKVREHYANIQDEAEAEREGRRIERENYRRWCQTSPEWHALCQRIMWRSRGICEACLENRADTVHHLTYDLGKLPPGWHLRAVCATCHARLHADKRGAADEWCPA